MPSCCGILAAAQLRHAAASGVITSSSLRFFDEQFQPASMDLRLGRKAYRLRCSFLPGSGSVAEKLHDYGMGEIDLIDGAVLERNQPYLIPLVEELALPQGLRGKANPKSSTGRLDIFTRVITDYSFKFDEIGEGYHGKLYLEVLPRSFTIKVTAGLSLNQLRLMHGKVAVADRELADRHAGEPLLYEPDGRHAAALALDDGIFLSLDLRPLPRDRAVGYRAKKNSPLLDLSRLHYYAPAAYWEAVYPEANGRIVLDPEEFYLLLSRERVSIPSDIAAEMVAYDPTSGELRTHYAGFFDPGFGLRQAQELRGTVAALEVRAHDVPFVVEDGQQVCKLAFEHLAELPDKLYGEDIGSSYAAQTTMLSKHFQLAEGQLALLN